VKRKPDIFENRPFVPDSPRVIPIQDKYIPKEGSKLTVWGMRILWGIKESGSSIGTRTLADILGSLGDYSGYMNMINSLKENGYIKVNRNSYVSLTRKGQKELA